VAEATKSVEAGPQPSSSRSFSDLVLVVAVLVGSALRLWDLGSTAPSIDESYTALAARLPLGDLVRHIDATDPHPPLAYIVLRPVAALTTDVGMLRTVSAVASIGALVLVAVWQRRAGVAGLVATAVFAVSPFQIVYARQIRMYGLLALAGVAAAWCAQRWLEEGGRRFALGAAAAGLVAAFSHAAGLVLLGALVLIPLLRRDRSAWEWRAAVAVASALFAVVWGAHTLTWSHESGALPTASLSWASVVVNETVAPVPDDRWLVLPLVAAGAAVLIAGRGPRARVWVCLCAAPVVVLYLASLSRGVFVPKSLVPYAWGTPVALGAVCGAVIQRSRALGAVAVVLVGLTVLPFTADALHREEGSGAAMDRLFALTPADEGVAVQEGEWQADSLVRWFGPVAGGRAFDAAGQRIGDVVVYWPSDVPHSSRASFVTMDGDVLPDGMQPCGPRTSLGGSLSVQCVDTRSEPAPGSGS
jgi:hypothetical protein